MITPIFRHRVLWDIEADGRSMCLPWGVEFADDYSFFSLEEGVGHRSTCRVLEEKAGTASHVLAADVDLRSGRFRLETSERAVDGETMRAEAKATCISDTAYLMDFVLRMRFRYPLLKQAEIAGETVEHRAQWRYHQCATDRVRLSGTGLSAEVRAGERHAPSGFAPFMYVKDVADGWVVHARFLPTRSDREVVKLCTRWYGTRPLPRQLGEWLLRREATRRALWYRGERIPHRGIWRLLAPSAFPLVRVERGETLRWAVTVSFGAPA